MYYASEHYDGFERPGLSAFMQNTPERESSFEIIRDLFRSIPSIESYGMNLLEVSAYFISPNDLRFPSGSHQREITYPDDRMSLSNTGAEEIMTLIFTPDKDLGDKQITDCLNDEVFNSKFWLYWHCVFFFEDWHSALELKRYICFSIVSFLDHLRYPDVQLG
jgi:oleate hydratase